MENDEMRTASDLKLAPRFGMDLEPLLQKSLPWNFKGHIEKLPWKSKIVPFYEGHPIKNETFFIVWKPVCAFS